MDHRQCVVRLTATNLTEDTGPVANPERGFFQYTETHYLPDGSGHTPLSSAVLAANRADRCQTLVFRYFVIEKYLAGGDIDADYLALVAADLAAVRAAGCKIVLRFAYSTSGVTSPPYSADPAPDRVLSHIQQLAPTLNSYADVIYAVQAGFIGMWGEWYYSDNFTADPGTPWLLSTQNWTDRLQVLWDLLTRLDPRIYILIRNVGVKQHMFGDQPFTDTRAARVGYHNDGFLAPYDDYGTYSTFTSMDVAATRAFLAADSAVPNGGESAAVNGSHTLWPDAATDLAAYHWTFLNPIYQPDVLASWGAAGQAEAARNLGYRLVGRQVRVASSVRRGDVMRFELDLANSGYAQPMSPRDVVVVLDDQAGHRQDHLVASVNVRNWTPGVHTLVADVPVAGSLPPGQYRVGLWLPDQSPNLRGRPEYALRLANSGTWNTATGYNDVAAATLK